MRADRLISVLMLLQRRGQVTAAEVARELEISTRTARRDLEALAMSGVPIYSQSGRGGGWRLIGGATTDLTGLSLDETRALFLALGRQAENSPVLDGALRKLLVALPDTFRNDASAATTAVRVDPTGWGQIGPTRSEQFVDELSQAVIAATQAEITYATPGNEPADRIVHPLGLVTKRNVWYLIANTDRGLRTFRLSRISRVSLLDTPVDRPADFDLDATWESIVTHVESHRASVSVEVWVDPSAVRPVRWVFRNGHEILEHAPDGRIKMRVDEYSVEAIAAQLIGFAGRVELLNPSDAIRAEMTRLTAELAQAWLA